MDNKQIIKKLLEKNKDGLTLSGISRETGINLDAVRIIIAQMEGAGIIEIQIVGNSKLIKLMEK